VDTACSINDRVDDAYTILVGEPLRKRYYYKKQDVVLIIILKLFFDTRMWY
jgi:hypothetical protein